MHLLNKLSLFVYAITSCVSDSNCTYLATELETVGLQFAVTQFQLSFTAVEIILNCPIDILSE